MKATEARSRVQFKNILFATDFSSAAGDAVPFAAELTKRYGAKLYALYVRPPVVNPMTPPLTWSGLEEAAAIEDARHEKELANAFAGIQPEILIKEGDIWSSLTAALEEKNIDLIVIGTRGRSGISKFVLGSIAEEIFRQAPCPVLTVGPNTPAPGKTIWRDHQDTFRDGLQRRSECRRSVRCLAGAGMPGLPHAAPCD